MKSWMLPFLLLISYLHSTAQNGKDQFRFGIKAGFNVSSFTKDVGVFEQPDRAYRAFERSSRGSVTAGLTLDLKLSERFTFGTELLFNPRGMGYKSENRDVEYEDGEEKKTYDYFTYKVDYLELPFTFNYNFNPETSKTSVSAYGGIAPAFNVYHKTKLKYHDTAAGQENQKSDLTNVRTSNYSLIAGVQLAENETFGGTSYVDLRGSYMRLPVFDQRLNDIGSNLNTHLYTFTLAFGLKF